MYKLLPNDIPLPLPVGNAEGVLIPVFHILLVVAFVVHILFINVLLGGSLASVWFNLVGVIRKDKAYDRAGYLMTTPVTISENMGALWGVAPLLIVSVMFTSFWYSSVVMLSPQILHIIYGNIVAFLLSYLYKFSWPHLQDRKGLHLSFGVSALLIFFSLPFVFMTAVQLYLTPETWKVGLRFWEAMLRPDVFFRLAHFFLASFAISGLFMILYGGAKRKHHGDEEAAEILVRTGRSWFVVNTGLNVLVGLLTFFQFPSHGIEAFYASDYHLILIAGVVTALLSLGLVVRDVVTRSASLASMKWVVGLMTVTVLAMATSRHGMRMFLLAPAQAQIDAKTRAYQSDVATAKRQAASVVTARAPAAPGEAAALRNGCLACHAVGERLVGPAYRDVARKAYSRERIIALIRAPEPDNWPGYGVMPAMSSVSDADAALIADWINGAAASP
jgi:cytochrome c